MARGPGSIHAPCARHKTCLYPGKQWLYPATTEKLLTGTLNHKTNVYLRMDVPRHLKNWLIIITAVTQEH